MTSIRKFLSRAALGTFVASLFFASTSHAQVRQTSLYIDDGSGHFNILQADPTPKLGGTYLFPSTGGTNMIITTANLSDITGGTSFTPGGVFYGITASTMGTTVAGTSGNVLVSGGAGAPTWAAQTGIVNTLSGDVTGASNNNTINTASAPTGNNIVTAIGQGTGVIGVANGGTGAATVATGFEVFASPAVLGGGVPGFRKLVDGDLPSDLSGEYIQNSVSPQATSNFNISGSGTIGTGLTVTSGGAAIEGATTINTTASAANTTSIGNTSANVIITGGGIDLYPSVGAGSVNNNVNVEQGNLSVQTGNIGVAAGSVNVNGGIAQLANNGTVTGKNVTISTFLTAGVVLNAAGGVLSSTAGALPVADGGTGAATLTLDGVLLGNGTSPISATAVGTNGQVLVGSTGVAPAFATIATGTGISTTVGAGTLQINNTGVTSFVFTGDALYPAEAGAIGTVSTPALSTQTANLVFAGPSTGSAAAPTFRSLVNADLPNNGSITINTTGPGLTGGGSVAPGGTLTLVNGGVTSLASGGGITASVSTGAVVLGSTFAGTDITGSVATAAIAGTAGPDLVTALNTGTSGTEINVAAGGTGAATLTLDGVLLGNGTSPISATAVGATNTVLHGNTGGDPTFSAIGVADLTPGAHNTFLTTNNTGVVGFNGLDVDGTTLTGDGSSTALAINSGYVGQTSITTLGTIATGTWQGTAVGLKYGGTGQDNTAIASNHLVFAGPVSSAPGTASFRLLDATDIPDLSGNYIDNQSSPAQTANFNISGSGTIGGTLNVNDIEDGASLTINTGAGKNTTIGNSTGSTVIATNTWGVDVTGNGTFVGLASTGNSTIATSGSTINTFASGGSSTNSFGSGGSSTNSFGSGGSSTNNFGDGASAINTFGIGASASNTIGSTGTSITTILGGTGVGINNADTSSGPTNIGNGASTGSVSIGNTTGGVTITSTNWSASGAALTAGGTATAGSLALTDGAGHTYTLEATTGGSVSPTFLLPTEPTVGPYTLATTGDNTDFVNSINNAASDATLTFAGTGSGPYAGAVTGKLNLDNANTWTNEVTIAPGSSHDVTSLLVEQTATASPLNAIMDVTNTGASTHYLTVDPTGNIGIGMATPSSQFSNFSTGTNIVDPYGTGGVNKTFTWVSNSGGYAATVDNSTAADMEDNGLLVKVANNRNASLALEVSSGDVGAIGTTLFDVWGNGNVTMSPSNADTISIGNNTVNTLTTITGGAAWSISDVGVGTFGQLLAGSGANGSDQLEVAGQATITTGGTAPYALSINNTSSAVGAEDISGNDWSILENGGASFATLSASSAQANGSVATINNTGDGTGNTATQLSLTDATSAGLGEHVGLKIAVGNGLTNYDIKGDGWSVDGLGDIETAGYINVTGATGAVENESGTLDIQTGGNALTLGNSVGITMAGPLTFDNTEPNDITGSGVIPTWSVTNAGAATFATVTSTSDVSTGGHIISTGAINSTATPSGDAISASVAGSDVAGTVTFATTESTGTGSVALTFGNAFTGTAPVVILTQNGPNGVGVITQVYVSSVTTNGFTINFADGTSVAGVEFNYIVVQP